jgi:hypothetical protein
MKDCDIIADNLSKPEWSLGYVSAMAHRGEGQRFIVRADEKLTGFIELESVIRACRELV